MNGQNETEILVESFCTLADEVQNLIDRKTILEHKLRFAAEQYQQLADKYAPQAPEISETLANLEVPPDHHVPPTPASYVPLPKRGQSGCNQHHIALLIRDGRRAAQQLSAQAARSAMPSNSNPSPSNNTNIYTNTNLVGGGGGADGAGALSGTGVTTKSSVMEQDFTVEGKKGVLDCPFSEMKREQQLQRQRQQLEQERQQLHITGGDLGDDGDDGTVDSHDHADTADMAAAAPAPTRTRTMPVATANAGADNSSNDNRKDNVADGPDAIHHDATDPICSAMLEETASQHAPSSGGAARCPIRFLNQHSPEVVASYVEKHKHELPRSHAICLRRYNKNEEQTRKIDAKYGSLVNMISGLGQFHQPMLAQPGAGGGGEEDPEDAVDRAALHRASHERVKNWAASVAASGGRDGDDDDNNGNNADNAARRRRSHSHSAESNTRRESSGTAGGGVDDNTEQDQDQDREGHFDRPFKEVRVGESPSRPWGIAVPISAMPHAETQPPMSPPAAPVRMPSPVRAPTPLGAAQPTAKSAAEPARKCPFDHSKFGMGAGPPPGHAPVDVPSSPSKAETPQAAREVDSKPPPPAPARDALQDQQPSAFASLPQMSQTTQIPSSAGGPHAYMPPKPYQQNTQYANYPHEHAQPVFMNLPPKAAAGDGNPLQSGAGAGVGHVAPSMVFTGPVFIGYPMDQAIQFMQHFQSMQSQGR